MNIDIGNKDMLEYGRIFMTMDVKESIEDSIIEGISLGIPLEYFIKTGIINEGNYVDFNNMGEYTDMIRGHFEGIGDIGNECRDNENTVDGLIECRAEDVGYTKGISEEKDTEDPDEPESSGFSSIEDMKDTVKEWVKEFNAENECIKKLIEKIDRLEERVSLLESGRVTAEPDRKGIKGIVISSYANKGGVGKTTVAVSMAKVIASMGKKTIVCDFDFMGRNVKAFFDIDEDYGNYFNELKKIDNHIVKVDNNLYVLPGSDKITSKNVNPKDIEKLLNRLKGQFDVIVVDTCPAPYEKKYMQTALSMSDLVMAVVNQSKFSREETKAYGGKLLFAGVAPEKIRMVINQFDPSLMDIKQVEDDFNNGLGSKNKIRVKTSVIIPEDWVGVNLATEEGRVQNKEIWADLYKEVEGQYNSIK